MLFQVKCWQGNQNRGGKAEEDAVPVLYLPVGIDNPSQVSLWAVRHKLSEKAQLQKGNIGIFSPK